MLLEAVLNYWHNTMNEVAFADWFKDTYVSSESWSGWFIGASDVPGVVANNNALESAQHVQKNTEATNVQNANNEHVFTSVIPNILANAKLHNNLSLTSTGPIPSNII